MSVRIYGAAGGITNILHWYSNFRFVALKTVLGGLFVWGGRGREGNGGAQRFPQVGWKSTAVCNGRRELNCETDGSSRCESRA